MSVSAFAVLAILVVGAFLLRKIPAIAIPGGLLLMAPFALGFGEQFVRGRDDSVGAMFVPLILFWLLLVASIGAFLFVSGILQVKPESRGKTLLGTALAIFVPAGIGFFWWSHANIEHVRKSAEQIAANEPYCIDVASGKERRPAMSSSDFSGYNMRAPHADGMYWGRHAILAVGAGDSPDLYHWSYNKKAFVADANESRPVYCQPRPHFANTFGGSPPADPRSIRAGGKRFSIPDRYRAKIHGAGLNFRATAPDFRNAPESESERDITSWVEVDFRDTGRTDAWLTRSGRGSLVEDAAGEYGLQAQTLWSVASDGRKKSSPPSFQYFELSSDNRVATVISCPDKVKWQCMHTFRSGGWTYTFRHSPTDLKHWKRMQEKLVDLTRSFVQAPAS